MSKANRYLEAFKESYNTVGLASAAAASLALLNPLPLLVGVVAEVAYLLTVPDSKWYTDRLAKRFDAEIEARRKAAKEATIPTLRPEIAARFAHLEEMRQQIDAQAQEDKAWFREVLRKLDYLLEKFLQFAVKEAQFRRYLEGLQSEVHGERLRQRQPKAGGSAKRPELRAGRNAHGEASLRMVESDFDLPPVAPGRDPNDRWVRTAVEEVQAHYEAEREDLEAAWNAETDDDTRAVLAKRMDVLVRRKEFAGKIGKILVNIHHQLQLTEDTFGLINDEIRARSPEQILADIDEVVLATNTMASALEELAPIEQMVARVAG